MKKKKRRKDMEQLERGGVEEWKRGGEPVRGGREGSKGGEGIRM